MRLLKIALLNKEDIPKDVWEKAMLMWDRVKENPLRVGDSKALNGFWIETHTLGCRNAGDDPEDQWMEKHMEYYVEYSSDGKSYVYGDPESGAFLSITPLRKF